MDKALKNQIIDTYKLHDKDTGSPEVQIALLTERINHLNEHLKIHKRIIILERPSHDGWKKKRFA